MTTVDRKELWLILKRKDAFGEPVPFDLEYFSANRRRRTGGIVKRIKAILLSQNTMRKASSSSVQVTAMAAPASSVKRVDPNHEENHTINIRKIPSGAIAKVHVPLIKSINAQQYFY